MRKILPIILLYIVIPLSAIAQKKVTGKVLDESGSELPGVSVLIKGTQLGTSTDSDGNYTLEAPASATLIFSFIGFEPMEERVGNRSVINVSMNPSNSALDEVVITAFGATAREKFTGSAGTIDASKIANRPLTNIGQAIAGSTAGVTTTAGSGQPGSAPDIRIRGFGSISSSNDPLYVVDGVPFSGNIANLNQDDIETITILKDAASTALYGARAANGVVMVTTKKGKSGKSNINVRFNNGLNSRGLPEYDRLSASEYYPLMWEQYRNSIAYRATNPVALETANADATNRLVNLVGYNIYNVPNNELVNTQGQFNPNAQLIIPEETLNWETPIMRQGNRNEVNLNFNGGTNASDYFFSFSYLNDKGFIIRSDYDRYTARLNYNSQVKPWLRSGANISATVINSNQADAGGNTSFVNPFFFSRNIGPIYPVYAMDPKNPGQFLTNPDGSRMYDFGNMNALGLPNRPQYGGRHSVAETELNENFFRRNVLGGRAYAEVTFLKDFRLSANFGTDITNSNFVTFGNPIIGDGAPAGRSTHQFNNLFSYNFNQLLNYDKSFGKNTLNVLLGHENYSEQQNFLSGARSQQILDGNFELVNFTTTTDLNSQLDLRRVEGYFSRVNYDYDNKYFISGSYRRDGSSKFYKDVRWGDFFSISGAWRIDQEAFMKDLTFINTLKLRSSYGQTGNDGDISRYAWQPLFALGWNNATEAGILQSSLGNRALEWESSNAYDVALEFGFLKNRVFGTIEYFNRQSSNLIFDVPLPLSAGITTETRNIGSMFNRGVELDLNIDLVRTSDFKWSVNLNAMRLRNEITRLPDENKEIIQGTKKLVEGGSIYDFWLREYTGIDAETGQVTYRAQNFVPANSFITETGDTLTTSVNNARFHFNGSAIPEVQGGFTNTFQYKNFTLSLLAVYQLGGKVYDGAYAGLMSSGGTYGRALHVDALQRWQKPGDITNVPRMDAARSADFDAASDRWLIDASYLNIRSLSLGYTLPTKYANKIKMENAQFFVSGENFFILSRRKGMNVQQNFAGTTGNVFSLTRSLVTGISFTL